MQITSQTRTTINQGLTNKKLKASDLAKHLGKGRSWASKLLGGTLKTLNPEDIETIESFLDVSLVGVIDETVSPTAKALSEIAEHDPDMAAVLEGLLALGEKPEFAFVPYAPTKELSRIGGEVTKIVLDNQGRDGDYRPKIGKEVLEYIREYFMDRS